MAGRRRDEEPTPRERITESKPAHGGPRESELERLVHDLEVHQEELRIQQHQLIESQRALEDARDRYAELFDFAPIAYVVLDVHGVIHEANLCAARLLGLERGLLLGKSLLRYVDAAGKTALLDHLGQCRPGRPRAETEILLQHSDGRNTPVQLTSSPASMRHDTDLFQMAMIDLTERKRSEAERARALEEQRRLIQEEQVMRAASHAKDRFLAMLSHELRTPLTPILFALDAVKSRSPIPHDLEPTLEMIRRNVLLETRLIDDLLDMTRIVQGKMSVVPETVDAHDVLDDVIALCRDQLMSTGVVLTVEMQAAARFVHADPVRLRQVVWNLLNNAVRNTPQGGRVEMRTENPSPEWFILTVSDTGRGIDPTLLPRIFALFEQDDEARRRGVGLGLGLAISKAIVESHGGRISAHSEGSGRGATFTVELRTVEATGTTPARRTEATADPARRTKVLLVEDNDDSAAAMAEFLRLHGYDVRVAGSVREALALLEGTDVLISDIALPDGTGHDLMRSVGTHRGVRGIALSGYGTPEDKRRSADAGFARHIVKPIEPDELLAAIEKLAPPRDDDALAGA
jgi:two-component system CheB/CheR fusion protein